MAGNTTPDNITYPTGGDKVKDINTQLATMASSVQAALTNRFNGSNITRQYTSKALMNAAPGTVVNQKATVQGDATATNNGDYYWSGSAWVMPICIVRRTTTALTSGVNAYGNMSASAAWSIDGAGMPYSSGITITLAGLYTVEWSILGSGSSAPGVAGIAVNAATTPGGDALHAFGPVAAGPAVSGNGMATVRLAVGDKLTLWGYGSGGAFTVTAATGRGSHWGCTWVMP